MSVADRAAPGATPGTEPAPAGSAPVPAQRSRWLLLGTVVALLVVYLPLLGPSLLGRTTFVETGVVLKFEPWVAVASEASKQGVTIAHDTVDFYLPRTDEFVDRLRDGDLALWEPYAGGGTPLGAVPDTALLSPLGLPFWVLPGDLAPAYVRLLCVLVAVAGTALFLRRLGVSRAPALLGGLLYSTSGFLVLWNGWPQAQIAALVPALFWAVERALQERRASSVVPVALVTAAMLLASFPAVLVHALYLLGPYVLVRLLQGRPGVRSVLGRGALVAGGLLLGLLLAAGQVLPFVERLGMLDLGYREQGPQAHPPVQALLTVLAPYTFGSETDGTWYGYRNTVETIAYAGVVCVVLAVAALVVRVRTPVPRWVPGYFAGSVAAIVLVGWVGGPFLQAAQALPLVGDSFIGRIRSVLALALAVLAAVGAEKLLRLPDRAAAVASGSALGGPGAGRPVPGETRTRRPVGVPALLLVAGLLGIGALSVRAALASARAADRTDALRDGLVPAAVVGAVLLVLLAVLCVPALSRRLPATVALGLLPVLAAVEALLFIAPRWPGEPRAEFYPSTGVHDYLARELGADRFAAARAVMFPSTNVQYDLRSVTGHAFQLPAWKQMIAAVDPDVVQGPTLTFLGEQESTARSPLLDRMAARFFVASGNAPVYGRREDSAPATGVAALPDGAPVRAEVPAGPKRSLVLRLAEPLATRGRLTATFLDEAGTQVGVVERPGLVAGQVGPVHLPLPDDLTAQGGPLAAATAVQLRLDGVSARVEAAPGGPALGVVRPADDGLRLAHAGESLVYRRLGALPRVRWASAAVHEPDAAQALALLGSDRLRDDQVVLPTAPPGAARGPAQVELVEDSGDVLRTRVRADGAGWLVVADALQHGWAAYLDGRRTDLQPADGALVAVPVPPGEHRVELRYEPPGRGLGLALSAGSAALLVLLAVGPRLARRRAGPARRR